MEGIRSVLTGSAGGDPHQIRLLAPLTLSETEALEWIPKLEAILATPPADA